MLEFNGWIPAHTLPLPHVHATAACRCFFMLPMPFVLHVVYSIKKQKKDLFHFLKLFSANAVLIAKYDITVLQIRQKLLFFFLRKRGPGKSHSRFAGNDVCQVIKRCSWCDCHSTRHSIKWMFGCKRDRL